VTISGVCSLWLCLMPHPRPCTNASSTIIGPRLGSVAPEVRIPPICWTTTQENSENPIPSPYPIRWCTGSKSQLNLMVSSRVSSGRQRDGSPQIPTGSLSWVCQWAIGQGAKGIVPQNFRPSACKRPPNIQMMPSSIWSPRWPTRSDEPQAPTALATDTHLLSRIVSWLPIGTKSQATWMRPM
jgi:hypothetical protein